MLKFLKGKMKKKEKKQEYSVKILVNIEMVTALDAKDNEELKDEVFDFLHKMDPRKAHYILTCGKRTIFKSEDGTKYERLFCK